MKFYVQGERGGKRVFLRECWGDIALFETREGAEQARALDPFSQVAEVLPLYEEGDLVRVVNPIWKCHLTGRAMMVMDRTVWNQKLGKATYMLQEGPQTAEVWMMGSELEAVT